MGTVRREVKEAWWLVSVRGSSTTPPAKEGAVLRKMADCLATSCFGGLVEATTPRTLMHSVRALRPPTDHVWTLACLGHGLLDHRYDVAISSDRSWFDNCRPSTLDWLRFEFRAVD
jgi:hypothetical protein